MRLRSPAKEKKTVEKIERYLTFQSLGKGLRFGQVRG